MGISAAVAAVSIGGTVAGNLQQRRAVRKQERSEQLNRSQAQVENQRRIRLAVSQARVDRAATIAQAEASGAGGSSSVAGALGSQRSQLASNAGFAQATAQANARSNALIGSSNRDLNRAGSFAALAGLPEQFGFSNQGLGESIAAARGKGTDTGTA